FVQCDANSVDTTRTGAEVAAANRFDDAIKQHPGEKLRRGVPSPERRLVVKIRIIERGQHAAKRFAGAADVDHQTVSVEFGPTELDVDDVGGTVQPLRGSEDGTVEAVSNHHVIANAECVHLNPRLTLVNALTRRTRRARTYPRERHGF